VRLLVFSDSADSLTDVCACKAVLKHGVSTQFPDDDRIVRHHDILDRFFDGFRFRKDCASETYFLEVEKDIINVSLG
jgi:hypothetical protein